VNEAFNSREPFHESATNPVPAPTKRLWIHVGGPFERDKTFFFVSFEQVRETQYVNNQYQTVPTLAYRTATSAERFFRTARVIGTDPAGRQMLEGMIYDPATTRAAPDGRLYRDQFPATSFLKTAWIPFF
jgi:hypothetical protein